jgi:hypothetical protein
VAKELADWIGVWRCFFRWHNGKILTPDHFGFDWWMLQVAGIGLPNAGIGFSLQDEPDTLEKIWSGDSMVGN